VKVDLARSRARPIEQNHVMTDADRKSTFQQIDTCIMANTLITLRREGKKIIECHSTGIV
jgi:hypothetical protein